VTNVISTLPACLIVIPTLPVGVGISLSHCDPERSEWESNPALSHSRLPAGQAGFVAKLERESKTNQIYLITLSLMTNKLLSPTKMMAGLAILA